MNIDGLIYLLNLSGQALAQANARVEELTTELADLKTASEATPAEV